MSWRVVFLVLLLVSAVAVTIGVSIVELDVVNVLAGGIHQIADPAVRPLEAIDDENPPG